MDTLEKTGLFSTLQHSLEEHPAGLSEYDLINHLKSQQHPLFVNANLSDVLSLFRTHFVLFHALYQMRDRLRAIGQFDLHISPLLIRLQPAASHCTTDNSAVGLSDPLRAYYLNLEHLGDTERADVEALLHTSFNRLAPAPQVTAALTELGLEPPLHALSAQELRSHYRQLVSLHHPDRGGCTARLQRINQAMDTLRAHHALSG